MYTLFIKTIIIFFIIIIIHIVEPRVFLIAVIIVTAPRNLSSTQFRNAFAGYAVAQPIALTGAPRTCGRVSVLLECHVDDHRSLSDAMHDSQTTQSTSSPRRQAGRRAREKKKKNRPSDGGDGDGGFDRRRRRLRARWKPRGRRCLILRGVY